MLQILAITGPIYIAIGIGFMATRAGLFAKLDLRVLGKFVIHIALPALLFNAMAQRRIGEILNTAYVFSYLAGTLLMLVLGWVWCRRRARLDTSASAVVLMGMACPNSAFVGYPILLLTVAPAAGVSLALNTLMENMLVIPLLLALAESGRGDAGHAGQVLRQTLARLVRNPMILALAAGLLVSLLGTGLPGPLARTVSLFAAASGALSLFVIGGTLVGLPLQGMGARVVPILLGKLLLHPLLVLGATALWVWLGGQPLDPALRLAVLVMAAVPMMSIYPILAQAYGHESLSAAALLAATVVSFFTLSGWLWWMG